MEKLHGELHIYVNIFENNESFGNLILFCFHQNFGSQGYFRSNENLSFLGVFDGHGPYGHLVGKKGYRLST